jgi:hypothetical protein
VGFWDSGSPLYIKEGRKKKEEYWEVLLRSKHVVNKLD